MDNCSQQTVDNLRKAAQQTTKSFKALTEGLNELTGATMKEGFERMTEEDAEKFSKFVNNGGLEKLFEGIKNEMQTKK